MPLPFNTSSLTSSLRSTIANNQPSLLNNIEKLSSQASSFAQKTGVFGPLHTNQQPAGPTNTNQQQQQQQSQRNAAQIGPGNIGSSGSGMINRGNNSNNYSDLRQSSGTNNNPAQGARNLTHNVAAPAGGGAAGPPVDLSHLTAEERAMIQSVMAKAEMVNSGLPVDTSMPSSTNLPSQTNSQALTMQQHQQHQSHMNSMAPSFNPQMMQPNQGQQQQQQQVPQMMTSMNQMHPQQQQQQQPYRRPMSAQMSDQNIGSGGAGQQQQHANPMMGGQYNQMMQPTSQQQTGQPLQQQQQQPQQTFQQSIGPNQQQQHMNSGPSNTNQLASLEQQTQQLVNQINSQFNLGGGGGANQNQNQNQQQANRINQQPQQSVNQMLVGPGGFGQSTTGDMMAVNNNMRGQLQHQQSLSSQPSVFTMSGGGGQSLPYGGGNLIQANSVQQQQPPSNQLQQQVSQHQMQPPQQQQQGQQQLLPQISGGVMPGAYNALANQQASQLATMPTMQQQQQTPQSILMSQQNYPNNSIDVMLQQQQQQQLQQQQQNSLQVMALQQQRQLSFDQNQNQFNLGAQPMANALAANYQATGSFLPQNLGAIYSAQQGMPTTGLPGGDGERARQSIRFKRDRSWHQEHAISDQENDESRVSSRNSRRNRVTPAANLGQLRRFDSASEVMMPQREGAGRQLPRPGKLQPAASLSRMQNLDDRDEGQRTRQTRPKRFSRARRNRDLNRETDESDLSCRSSESELSISSADPPSQHRAWRPQLAAEGKRAPERRKARRDDDNELELTPKTQASESAGLATGGAEKVLNELKLTEQANRVMEQQQQLIKQSQDLIKLQQAQLEQKSVSLASGAPSAQRLEHQVAADLATMSATADTAKTQPEVLAQPPPKNDHKPRQVCEETEVTPTVKQHSQSSRPAKASAATDTHDLPVASDSPAPLDYEPLPPASSRRRSPGLSRQQHTSTSRHDLYADQHQHHQRAPMLTTRASSLRAAKFTGREHSQLDSPTDTTDSDLEMLSSRLTPLGGRRHHRSGRHLLTPTSGKHSREALARACRQPTGLPPSPLPVAAAIQLHQLQQQHHQRSNAELDQRSRSACNSPRQQQQHWRTGTGGYGTRPCSPADVAALCHDYGQRKQLPDPPSNAAPLTPSMVRKMVQAQRAAATNPSKLLTSVNAQSTLLTNMHSQRRPCLDRLPTSAPNGGGGCSAAAQYAAANRATATLHDEYSEQRQAEMARDRSINKPSLAYCATPGSYTAKLSGAQVSFADEPACELRDLAPARSNGSMLGAIGRTTELGEFLDSTYGTSILKQQSGANNNVDAPRSEQQVVDRLMGNLDSFYGLDKRSDLLRENVLDAISSRSHYDAARRSTGSPSLTRRRTDYAHGKLTLAGYSPRLPAASYTPSGSYAAGAGASSFSGRRNSEGELTYLGAGRQQGRSSAYGQAAGRHVMFGPQQHQQQRVTRQTSGAAYELSPSRLASPTRAPYSSLATARQRLAAAGYGDTHVPVDDDDNLLSQYRTRDNLTERPQAPFHANYSRPESATIQRLRSLGSTGTSLDGGARRLNYANWSPITASAADNFAPAGRASYLQRPGRMISDCRPGGSGGFTQYESRHRTSGPGRLGNYQPRSFDLG